ncbi:MAG: hypothetical protein AAF410_06820, partial [Pseudomonadota bacterium]
MKLSKEQIQQFKNTGYLLIRELYGKEMMNNIIDWTEELSNYPEVPGKYMMYFENSKLKNKRRILSRMEDIEPFHRGFSELFTNGSISRWLRRCCFRRAYPSSRGNQT